MKFGKLLAGAVEAMPREYRDMFLDYKLFKQHISLYDKGACRCAVQRELEGPTVEELSSYASGPHSAAAPAFLRELPCCTDPCRMSERPVLHNRNQQAGPKSSITFQAFTFERLLDKQLSKINKFFNRSHQEYIATMNELHAMNHQEGFWIETDLLGIRRCVRNLAAKMELLANFCYLNHSGFLKILKKHDRITGSDIRRKFSMQTLNHMDFVLYASAVNEDAEYCLSLLNRIPDPNMRSGTRGWPLPRSQTTHVQSDGESSTQSSSSSAAAHPSPLMSTRGRELSLHLRQQRLQLLSSSDGDFNYITAANAAKAANRMVCNTVSSTFNSDSVLVLYRGGPIWSPASSLAIHKQQLAHEDADFML